MFDCHCHLRKLSESRYRKVYGSLYRTVVIMYTFFPQSLFVGGGGGECYLVLKTSLNAVFPGSREAISGEACRVTSCYSCPILCVQMYVKFLTLGVG